MNIDYPFESGHILKKKRAIKRCLSERKNLLKKRIAILSGSTIGCIKDVLELFLLNAGIEPEFYVGQYNRFYEDIMFENRELSEFKPDFIYIHTTTRNLSDSSLFQKLSDIWVRIDQSLSCPVIQNNFELPYYGSEVESRLINELNLKMDDYAKERTDFYINDIQRLSAGFGLDNWFDEQDYLLYKYALSVKAVPLLCHNIAKIIKSVYGKNQKCLVLDLDNTLWGGIVGEVGASGIELGPETALGEAYSRFQKYVRSLKDRGVILAVCSKNDEKTAKDAFDNPNMALRLEDFAVFCANWNNKAENIARIAESLNILPESMVFVDDNPAERQLVSQAFPEIKVLEADSVTEFIRLLECSGYFYPTRISEDDIKRSEYYASNAKRSLLKSSFADYGQYLDSLNMSSQIRPFEKENIDRITQLINKTNQFNLTTKRFTATEIDNIANDGGFITLSANLNDKFGANGIVSALIGEIDGEVLHIRLWVMSCRVFKRELELAVFDSLAELCREKGLNRIAGYYFKTDKNAYVSTLFDDLGFSKASDGIWELSVIEYKPKNSHIKIEGGNM